MKTIRNLSLFTLMIVAFLLSSCSKTPKSAKLIPENANVVMRFDVKQIAEKSGLEKDDKIKNELKGELKKSGLPKALQTKMEAILDDPAKSGVDLREPIFAYVVAAPKPKVGIVGSVLDAKEFESLINDVSKEMGGEQLKDENGLRYMAIEESLFAFNDESFAFIGNEDYNTDPKKMLDEVKEQFASDGKKTMYENEFFKQMCGKKGVAQILVNYNGLEKTVPGMMEAMTMMPEGIKLDDIAYLTDIDVKEGESAAVVEILSKSKQWDDLMNKNKDICPVIKGDLLKYTSKDGFALLANINGPKWYEFFKTMPIVKKIPKEAMDLIQKAAMTINGDISMSFSDIDLAKRILRFNVMIQTKDAALVDMSKTFGIISSDIPQYAPSCYAIPANWGMGTQEAVNFGFKNNLTFFFAGKPGQDFLTAANPVTADDVKNRRMYMYFNFNLLNKVAESLNSQEKIAMKEVAKIFEYAEAYDESTTKFIIRLVNKDKKKNIFQLLYTTVGTLSNLYQQNFTDDDLIVDENMEQSADTVAVME
ncbi:MAG: DUF4836 family protein [Prevotellaceae bacterium]|nr:DUF4836 family protein [Prevotella sp.]MDD7531102.1 DUF4836 family protein [Prevotellaceae bacterium]MDY2633732.1 DUF4836 family protein [Prevotella sp.]